MIASPQHYCLFDTAIGVCGIAWSGHGVTRFQLPESAPSMTERRLRTRTGGDGGAPPPAVVQAIANLLLYFAGERIDFSPVDVDVTSAPAFHRLVYEQTRRVGWGETATYGELARRAGSPREAREVGQAMARNPVPVIIPCHRVLASGNKVGGFSAYGGTLTKERLLALEGVRIGVPADEPLLPGL